MARSAIREICNVVLRATAKMTLGNQTFFKGEPVLYFDSLTTSSLEGSATTVYAQGGRGNTRLASWDGEKTLTFNMTDALISPKSIAVLTGAGLISADNEHPIKMHATQLVKLVKDGTASDKEGALNASDTSFSFKLKNGEIAEDETVYVMLTDGYGNPISEPILAKATKDTNSDEITVTPEAKLYSGGKAPAGTYDKDDASKKILSSENIVLIDFYKVYSKGATQIDITPESFGNNFYLEADTLFRDVDKGTDYAAAFIIPNCKIQSNFTFTMAATGDPSTFDFVLDAFPGYSRFDPTKKVLAICQILDGGDKNEEYYRTNTLEANGGSIDEPKPFKPAKTHSAEAQSNG